MCAAFCLSVGKIQVKISPWATFTMTSYWLYSGSRYSIPRRTEQLIVHNNPIYVTPQRKPEFGSRISSSFLQFIIIIFNMNDPESRFETSDEDSDFDEVEMECESCDSSDESDEGEIAEGLGQEDVIPRAPIVVRGRDPYMFEPLAVARQPADEDADMPVEINYEERLLNTDW